MREYSYTLEYRLRHANRRRERYASDPDYRLRLLNDNRKRKGKPPVASLDEVGSDLRAFACSRQRDEAGRFI
jgi:hypothetical protein